MERAEAEQCWQMISTVYGLHPERVHENAPTWVDALSDMDTEIVVSIVSEWMRGEGPERLPTIVAFAASVRREVEKRKPARPTVDVDLPKPVWVYAWELAREEKLAVSFPEQEGGYYQLSMPWPPPGRELLTGDAYNDLMARAAELAKNDKPRQPLIETVPECQVCQDSAWVEVGVRVYQYEGVMVNGTEQMAPCPVCPAGRLLEHPLERRGAWGDDGFWKGSRYRVVRAGVVEMTS